MNDLQKSLLGNALFSTFSGLLLILIPGKIAQVFDVSNETVFWIIGIALLFFATSIFLEISWQRPSWVLLIIAQDFLWVIGSSLLLIIQPFQISFNGNLIIALVAVGVFFFALAQSNALAKLDRIAPNGMKRFSFERIVSASRLATWQVISDVANYHVVAPNIDQVNILSGSGTGMIRSCSQGKNSWTETCTLWQEEDTYAFEVNTQAPDYPFPLKYLKGTWQVETISSDRTKIKMFFDFQYKHKIQQVLFHPLMKGKFAKICEELLDNWEKILAQSNVSVETFEKD